MSAPPSIALGFQVWSQFTTWDALMSAGRAIDERGFEALYSNDHFMPVASSASRSPGGEHGPVLEGWIVLAGWAAVTRRARLGCLVSGAGYRNPGLLVKMATALDHASGRDAWVHETGDSVTAAPAVVNGLVLAGSEDYFVYALDAASGRLRWRVETGLGIASAPAVADGRVFVASKDGHLYALALDDGKEVWKSASMRTMTAAPLAGDSIVCIQTHYGETHAFDIKTGKELWAANLGGSLQSTPIVTPEAVYLATYQGVVYALR